MSQPLKTACEMYPLVEKYIEGDLTQKAFCADHDITTSQLNYWLAKFRRLAATSKTPAAPEPTRAPYDASACDFIEITPPSPPAEQVLLEVVYPHGVRLRLFTPVAPSYLERLDHRLQRASEEAGASGLAVAPAARSDRHQGPACDTAGMRKIGEEVTETLDYCPAKLTVIRRVRPKYVDPRDEDRGVVIGALPPRPVDKGMAEPALLAHVVIEKYVDHLPLYRQVQRFNREGITLSSSTLGDWITATADLLVPLYEALAAEALRSGYIRADEMPIQVQDNQKSGTTHRGYYWVYHAPTEGLVVMDYQRGRSREGPEAFLGGYAGALQSDGYAAYDAFDRRENVTAYGCWAHARRSFHEALASAPERAGHALEEIGQHKGVHRPSSSTPSNGCSVSAAPRHRSDAGCAGSRPCRYSVASSRGWRRTPACRFFGNPYNKEASASKARSAGR